MKRVNSPLFHLQLSKTQYLIIFLTGIILLSVIISAQAYLQGGKTFKEDGPVYTRYNNYVIFTAAAKHLGDGSDLYKAYPAEHWDLFKYSPAFALFMSGFAALPDLAGLILWNLLNLLVLMLALRRLINLSGWEILLFILIFIPELVSTTQNSQSNALIAGLLLLSFSSLEKKNIAIGSLLIVSTIFIKIFGIVALLLFLLYPQKLKAAVWTLVWILVFTFLPLVSTPFPVLMQQYASWWELLQNDHAGSIGISVAGWLHSWFGWNLKNTVLLTGTIILLAPLLNLKAFNNPSFRKLLLSSILIWIVIFNHKAESPTFIIAITGIVLWFFMKPRTGLDTTLLFIAMIFTSLITTDLFPADFRLYYVKAYAIKAVPCILIWLKITFELLTFKNADSNRPISSETGS